jgi:YHS domain-containing protein
MNALTMNFTKHILSAVLLAGLTAGVLSARADDKHDHTDKTAKPYPLTKCVVSGEKFEGSAMKPHEFAYNGQAIKLCCKSCLKDFNKEPAKYLKKIEEEAQKTPEKK